MKAFSRILLVIAALAIGYHYFSGNDGGRRAQPPAGSGAGPQSPPAAPAPSSAPPPTYPDSVADRLLPVWPPSLAGDDTASLADVLTRNNFVLILDGSGSMSKTGCSGERSKMEVAREAVIEWAASIPEDANLGLVVFDANGFSIRLPLGLGNREAFIAEARKVVPDYKTPLTMALDTAYEMLTAQGRKQLGYGEYTVVIVTDGIANDIAALTQSVNRVLATSPIMIHTIGFCITEDHTLNRRGRTSYRAANNPAELRRGLQEVLAESDTFDISGFE